MKNKMKNEARKGKFDGTSRRLSIIKLTMFSLIVILTLLTTFSTVQAIGITPGRRTFDYKEDMKEKVEFRVINNEYKEMDVQLYKDGFLSSFIEFEPRTVHFNADEESKTFSYTLKVGPIDLAGGSYEGSIVAVEIPRAGREEVGTSATPGVATQAVLRIPYPGQYVEAELQIGESAPGEKVQFAVVVTNLGSQPTTVKAKIDILQGNKLIQNIEANPITLNPTQRNALRAEWPAFESGVFKARATVNYAGKFIVIEKEFKVSGEMIEIKRIFVKNYRLNEIAKVAIVVESKWNEVIKNVYGHLIVTNQQSDIVGDFKSASIDLKPKAIETIYAYWDTEGVPTGDYDGKIILNYEDKQIEKLLKAQLGIDSLQINIVGLSAQAISSRRATGNISTILVIIIIILALLNMAWFLYFKRKKRETGNIQSDM